MLHSMDFGEETASHIYVDEIKLKLSASSHHQPRPWSSGYLSPGCGRETAMASQAGQVCRVSRLRPGAGAGLSLVRTSQFRAVIGQKAGDYLVSTSVRIPLVTMLP